MFTINCSTTPEKDTDYIDTCITCDNNITRKNFLYRMLFTDVYYGCLCASRCVYVCTVFIVLFYVLHWSVLNEESN